MTRRRHGTRCTVAGDPHGGGRVEGRAPRHGPAMPHAMPIAVGVLGLCGALAAAAQTTAAASAVDAGPRATELPRVEVVSPGPLPGLGVPRDQVPSNVQTLNAADLARRHALDLSDGLGRTLGSVTVNALQSNPFQPDVNFRGFTASPLLGTPQGLSVYLDGVRLNQPFGDVVSWDLIPRSAIASVALMPGSNPLFGLNTLGGALSVQTKDGRRNPGTSVQFSAGSQRRVAAEFETGGSRPDGLDWFVTGQRFHERGWRRAASPSDVRQLFGKLGSGHGDDRATLAVGLADNDLTGNGLQTQQALQQDWRSSYTIPDQTRNRSAFVNLAASRSLSDTLTLSGNAYYRRIRTRTLNGDLNDDSLAASVYQPDAAERAALAQAGYSGVPDAGADASNTPLPRWRCIADALLNTEPNERCNGLINRTSAIQHNAGATLQLEASGDWAGLAHRTLVGAAIDASRVRFTQGTQFGYLNADRSITPVSGPGAFADGTQSSEGAFDARVDLASRSRTASLFASDSVAFGARTHVTLSGRYNRYRIDNADAITPGGGAGSLDGHHTFAHFNPALGLTFAQSPALTWYAGIARGSRAPSAVELGCADPASPCKLPNAFAGDPPLKQVVTTSVEAGARGSLGGAFDWNVGVFRADNRDDLLFVADNTRGFGYFRNFGATRRQGVEAGVQARPAAGWSVGATFTWLDATYRSPELIDGSSNSSNDAALAGSPGMPGVIRIEPGDRIPLLPRRVLKLRADVDLSATWSVGADLVASSGSTARGNENGQHVPDGVFYTGPGRSAGYALLNMSADYRPTSRMTLFVQVSNVLDRRYSSGAQLGTNGFDANGRYVARALAADASGSQPVPHTTFLAPGAPRAVWVGWRYRFDD